MCKNNPRTDSISNWGGMFQKGLFAYMANEQNEVGIFALDHNMNYHGLFVLLGKDLLSNVVLTLQEAREHAKRCKEILYNQKLSMQSYLDVLLKKNSIFIKAIWIFS